MYEFIRQILASKTQWLALIGFFVALLGFAGNHEYVAQNPELAAWVLGVYSVLNFINRFFTELPLKAKRGLFTNEPRVRYGVRRK